MRHHLLALPVIAALLGASSTFVAAELFVPSQRARMKRFLALPLLALPLLAALTLLTTLTTPTPAAADPAPEFLDRQLCLVLAGGACHPSRVTVRELAQSCLAWTSVEWEYTTEKSTQMRCRGTLTNRVVDLVFYLEADDNSTNPLASVTETDNGTVVPNPFLADALDKFEIAPAKQAAAPQLPGCTADSTGTVIRDIFKEKGFELTLLNHMRTLTNTSSKQTCQAHIETSAEIGIISYSITPLQGDNFHVQIDSYSATAAPNANLIPALEAKPVAIEAKPVAPNVELVPPLDISSIAFWAVLVVLTGSVITFLIMVAKSVRTPTDPLAIKKGPVYAAAVLIKKALVKAAAIKAAAIKAAADRAEVNKAAAPQVAADRAAAEKALAEKATVIKAVVIKAAVGTSALVKTALAKRAAIKAAADKAAAEKAIADEAAANSPEGLASRRLALQRSEAKRGSPLKLLAGRAFLLDESNHSVLAGPQDIHVYLNQSQINIRPIGNLAPLLYTLQNDIRCIQQSDQRSVTAVGKTLSRMAVSGIAWKLMAGRGGAGAAVLDYGLRGVEQRSIVAAEIVFRDFSMISFECNEADFAKICADVPPYALTDEAATETIEHLERIHRMAEDGSRIYPELTETLAKLTSEIKRVELDAENGKTFAERDAARGRLEELNAQLDVAEPTSKAVRCIIESSARAQQEPSQRDMAERPKL
jgi:hypothetical protein